ncbi:MAG: glycoside hydrolase family 2 TIM barrel-domain containing protein [Candidatus Glassbacteria bacterium]
MRAFIQVLCVAGLLAAVPGPGMSAAARQVIDLNGTWEFEQTAGAFPPAKFTRRIPVPGLVFLAEPRIEQYDAYYAGTYEPRYNWYRRKFVVPAGLKGSLATVTLLKSKYVTRVYLNGIDLGRSIACYTPVEFPAGGAVRFGAENELLISVGDRKWLPSEAAGSTDKEKVTYWPGIWDDVSVSFTGNFRIDRLLVLPEASAGRAKIKVRIRSFQPAQIRYGDTMLDSCRVEAVVREKNSNKIVARPQVVNVAIKRDNLTVVEIKAPVENPRLWTPDDPFLYTVSVALKDLAGGSSDQLERDFGLRDFSRDGRHFTLNGDRINLRGTNVTLHRFFEDPECRALPWDRQWVKKLLADIPKSVGWNAMRVCVGIAPSHWYEIADSCGLLLQNEWLYWQNHGWNDQIRQEYTDWVWTDGSHPSIVIWDAINENWDDYVGNELIPELKRLDPTRIWDAGYMTNRDMALDEMDEPHPYEIGGHRTGYRDNPEDPPYPLGDLNYWPRQWASIQSSSAAQLVNEYGWVWLWRDGRPAKLTEGVYAYYLGKDATPEQRRSFQAYWVQCQTEWLRTERSLAGVLAFCYLTNNFGFTGDWFTDISKLSPAPALEWFRHAFAPAAVFIDLRDDRYIRETPAYPAGGKLAFDLVGVNDFARPVAGSVTVRLLDSAGRAVTEQTLRIEIPAWWKKHLPVALDLPQAAGGYTLVVEFRLEGIKPAGPFISRRYLKVGEPAGPLRFYEPDPGRLDY